MKSNLFNSAITGGMLLRCLAAVSVSLGLLVDSASAQSLRATGISVFVQIYSMIGIVGGIASLVTALNWATGNWMAREDPKKTFITTLLAVACAFGVVAVIQFLKDIVGGTASSISNL